jgi:hypothetical protein
MPNTTIKETLLAANLQQNINVRARIEAIVRDKLWEGTGDPTVSIDMEALAWAVASEDGIRKAVRDAMDDEENTNINKNTDAIGDVLLYTTVGKAMTRLKIGTPPA